MMEINVSAESLNNLQQKMLLKYLQFIEWRMRICNSENMKTKELLWELLWIECIIIDNKNNAMLFHHLA